MSITNQSTCLTHAPPPPPSTEFTTEGFEHNGQHPINITQLDSFQTPEQQNAH